MSGGMYLIQDNDQLVEMTERPYDSEALLQELLAKYPSLLAGDQINSASPRRWLLVAREAALPAQENGPDRWSVDHLFLDQDAIPTIVEVKRSTDTRIRREVVGQMLDYAANGVLYWPLERIRSMFQSNCETHKIDTDEAFSAFIGDNSDQEEFWNRVKTNLQAGRVRLVFVADLIPPELRRVVEFLNVQMDPAEVLAVEIKQYIGQGLRTLVPRVVGQTASSQQKKASGSGDGHQWDETSFFAELARRSTPAEVKVARRLFDWANERKLRIWWGKGRTDGAYFPMLDHKGATHWTFAVWTYKNTPAVELQFQWMKTRPPFDDEGMRSELLRRLNDIPGVQLPDDSIGRRPGIPLSKLSDAQSLDAFIAAFDWVFQQVRSQ